MEKEAKIYVAGHLGMVGSSIVRKLQNEGYNNLLLKTSIELDLRNQGAVENFFATEKPEYVFLAAAKVGGIMANNTYRANFLYENLMIESNVIHQSYVHKVKKLLFLGSSCIYPKLAPQPLKESYLLSGYLEDTNEPYAIAKIAGIKLCESYRRQHGCDFISAMPTNLYGPNDNYDLNNSHVIPALIRKFVRAKENEERHVEIWGTGKPLREFLHVDDLADACYFLMNNYSDLEFVNVGSGSEISIKNLAKLIKELSGFKGELKFDASKPDGTPRKLMSNEKLAAMHWMPRINLREGLEKVIGDYTETSKV
ncbi:MAG TPA: GDP-L-fucose synthase [Cyclobacteriaceae bacterium]|nr:GDP-L-fucose synthase [Cyclobacteriaceae bacterium]